MIINNIENLLAKEVSHPSAKNASMKVLVSPLEGWQGWVMRLLIVGKDGYTPKHSHPWPHINFMVSGEGELMVEGEVTKVSAGSYAYVPANKLHQFKNIGEQEFQFICIVPEEGHK